MNPKPHHCHRSRFASLFVTALLAVFFQPNSFGQGCVIARGGGAAMIVHGDGLLEAGQWQASLGYRWLHSDRHFVGREEQPQRQENGTEVINDSHFIDVTGTYAITKRLWANLTIPFVYSDRSSLYEHDRVNRYHTQASGLADVRLTGSFWVLNPNNSRGNFSIGVGVKMPTGGYEETDIFYRTNGPTLRYVDSSIQPGDGGWGIVLETQGFLRIVNNLSGYMNGSYLINPRERVPTTGFSVPDAYLGRAGLDYLIWPSQGLSLSLGGRIEGVPPEDVTGGSLGSRRPGYAISIEPGISLTKGSFYAGVTTPVAIERNRQRTYNAQNTGDAAFADFTVNATFAYRF